MYLLSKNYCPFMLNTDQRCIIIAFLDASKASDRLNRCKLLTKLENQGVAKYCIYLASD